jgi:tRNA splicing ligase
VKSFKTAITVAVSLHKAKPEMYIEIKSDDDYELDLNLVVCTNPTYKGVVIEIGENGEEIFEQYVGKEYSEWQKIAKLAYNYLFE